jgi:uncharacterized membrane protein SpoIIM required for sporulation
MREKVLAFVVATATFGVVNGAIVGVGLAVAEPEDRAVLAEFVLKPQGAPAVAVASADGVAAPMKALR